MRASAERRTVPALWREHTGAVDEEADLALLSVDAKDAIPLPLHRDAKLKPGQRVIVIGHPLGLDTSVSDGVISGIRRVGRVQNLQITAPTSPGSSGSPVLDDDQNPVIVGAVGGVVSPDGKSSQQRL
jgi:serine protease Do